MEDQYGCLALFYAEAARTSARNNIAVRGSRLEHGMGPRSFPCRRFVPDHSSGRRQHSCASRQRSARPANAGQQFRLPRECRFPRSCAVTEELLGPTSSHASVTYFTYKLQIVFYSCYVTRRSSVSRRHTVYAFGPSNRACYLISKISSGKCPRKSPGYPGVLC